MQPVVVSEAKYVQCVDASPHLYVCTRIISCSSWLCHCGHALVVVHDIHFAWTYTLAVRCIGLVLTTLNDTDVPDTVTLASLLVLTCESADSSGLLQSCGTNIVSLCAA